MKRKFNIFIIVAILLSTMVLINNKTHFFSNEVKNIFKASSNNSVSIEDYVTDVEITDQEGNVLERISEANTSNMVSDLIDIKISFEIPTKVLKNNDGWADEITYQLPSSLIVNDINTDRSIYDENGTVVGNYEINDDGLVIFELDEESFSLGTIIKIQIDYWGRVDFSETMYSGVLGVVFNDSTVYEIYIERTPEISLIKNQTSEFTYNRDNSSLEAEYSITISTISGTDNTITLKDTVTGCQSSSFEDINIKLIDENGNETDITDEVDTSNFGNNTVLPKLKAANKYVVSYKFSGAVNSKGKGNVLISNKAEVSSTLENGEKLEKEVTITDNPYYEGVDYSTIAITKYKREMTPTEDNEYIYQTYRLEASLYNVKENINIYDIITAYKQTNKVNVRIDNMIIDNEEVDYTDFIESILDPNVDLTSGSLELFRFNISGTGKESIIIDYTIYASKTNDFKVGNKAYVSDSNSTKVSSEVIFEYIKPQPILPSFRIATSSQIDDNTCSYDGSRNVTISSVIEFNTNHADLDDIDNKLVLEVQNSALNNIVIKEYDENGNFVDDIEEYTVEGKKITVSHLNNKYSYIISVNYLYNTVENEFTEKYNVNFYFDSDTDPYASYSTQKTVYISECALETPELLYSAIETKYNCVEERLEDSNFSITINSNNKNLTGWYLTDGDYVVKSFTMNVISDLEVKTFSYNNFNNSIRLDFVDAGNEQIRIKVNGEFVEGTFANNVETIIEAKAFSSLGEAYGSLNYDGLDAVENSVDIPKESDDVCADNVSFDFIETTVDSSCVGNKSKVTTYTLVDINTAKIDLGDFTISLEQDSSNNEFNNTITKINLYSDDYNYTIEGLSRDDYSMKFNADGDLIYISGTEYKFNKDDLIHMEIYTEDVKSNVTHDGIGYVISATYNDKDKGSLTSNTELYNLKVCSPVISVGVYDNVDSCNDGIVQLQYNVTIQKPAGSDVDLVGTSIEIVDSNLKSVKLGSISGDTIEYDNNIIEIQNSTNPDKILIGNNIELDKDTNKLIFVVVIEKQRDSTDYAYPNSDVKVRRNNEIIYESTVNNSYYINSCYSSIYDTTTLSKTYKSVVDEDNKKILKWNTKVVNDFEKEMSIYDYVNYFVNTINGVVKPLHYMTYDQVADIQISIDGSEFVAVDPSIVTVKYRVLDPDTNTLSGEMSAKLNTLESNKENVYIYSYSFLKSFEILEVNYETTFDLAAANVNYNYTVRNYVEVTDVVNGAIFSRSAYTTIRKKDATNLIKKETMTADGEFTEGIDNIHYEEGNTYMYYRLSLNKNSYLTTTGYIVDVLPEGTTLAKDTWSYGGISCTNSYGSFCKNGVYMRFASISNGTLSNTSTYYYLTYTYDENTRELRISIPSYLYNYSGYMAYIYYRVKVVEHLDDDKTYTNKVTVTTNGESIESNEVTNKVLTNKLQKEYDSYSSYSNEIKYHFVFNPNGTTIDESSNGSHVDIDLIDELDYSAYEEIIDNIELSTINAYYFSLGEKGDPVSIDYDVINEDNKFTLNMSLPDDAALYIEYVLVVDYKTEDPLFIDLLNTIRLADPTINYAYSQTNVVIKENFSKVLAATNAISLKLTKVDSKNNELKLNGAKFSLERKDGEQWVILGEIETVDDGTVVLSTDEPVLVNSLYRLKELEAPLGYEVKDEYQYFYYESNMFNQKTSVDGIDLLDIVDYHVIVEDDPVNEISSVVNPNTKTFIKVVVFMIFLSILIILLNIRLFKIRKNRFN